MKNALKKAISVLLVAVMVFGAAPLAGFVGIELPEINLFSTKAEAATSGTCGDNLTWTLDESTGELVISGEGAMTEWTYTSALWNRYDSSIKSVIITDGVTSIGSYAFYDCDNLTSVTIGNSVITIGTLAFAWSDSLTSVTIGNSLTTICDGAFWGCTSLTSVILPDGATSIGDSAFRACNNLTSATIPDSVTSIGDYAFSDCGSLTSVTIPDSIISIGCSVFYCCESLKSVEIPDDVISIGDFAFLCCTSLTNITIPNNVTSIGMGAFAGCEKLTSITIPDSVTSMGLGAFSSCTSLENAIIGKGVTSITSSAFTQCKNLKDITIAESVESIGNNAFYNCINIENVYYGGLKSEWKKVVIEDGNEHLTSAKIHYNSTWEDDSSTEVPDNTPDYDSSVSDSFLVSTPTETKISYGDSIVLHVDPSKIPEGGRVEWYASNNNFSYSVSSDGTTCTITPDKKGDTTFTAVIYDEDGNIVSADKQEMTSKAGFFDKIIAFFKKLFGMTKVIPQAFKVIF